MKHKRKIKIARSLVSNLEKVAAKTVKRKFPIFDSTNWNNRKKAIAERVKRQVERATSRRLAREEEKENAKVRSGNREA